MIVENAHPQIITEQEALEILKVRRKIRGNHSGPLKGRARQSRFLLTGGISKCSRCGKNLVGHHKYYVCGSEPYRAGRGCGEGVYVPQLLLESEVIKDIQEIIVKFADPSRFTKKVNEELRRIWKQESGYDPNAEKRIREIDKKINHIRGLLLDGLDDVVWANQQHRDLREERDTLSVSLTRADKPIQVDQHKAMKCRARLRDILDHGSPTERKEYVQKWVDRVTLLPDEREIQIQYRVPESVTDDPIMISDSTGHQPAQSVTQDAGGCLRIRYKE